MLEVIWLVEKAIGEGLRCRLMWHSLKCNQIKLLPFGRDGDFRKLMKGNDEYEYLYMGGSQHMHV